MTPAATLGHIVAIARTELALFRRYPRLTLAAAAVALVPALYALIYLSSVWDPVGKTSALPVALVDLDRGYTYKGRELNVGHELTAMLERQGSFGFRRMDDAEAAARAVRRGELAFAVVIPADFSRNAIPGETPGSGQLRVLVSEGNNYSAAGMARRFAAELGHRMNETLNERRWALVLDTAAGAGHSLERLKAGVAELRGGARALDAGAGRYAEAAAQLGGGMKQVAGGVRQMEARLPAEADLKTLKSGSQQLAAGQRELGKGLEQLQGGARQLVDGAGQLRDQSAGIPLVGAKVSRGADQLAGGAGRLVEGLDKAREASGQLAAGAGQVEAGTARLADGMGALGDGLRTLAGRLPDDATLDSFTAGGKTLAAGSHRLAAGIELLAGALPAEAGAPDGSARGLADSVEPRIEVFAPVANNGSAFAPNMVAVALWIGAVMTAYLFNFRLIPQQHAMLPGVAKAVGKYAAPALVVAVQAVLACLMVVFGLGVATPDLLGLLATMLVASLVFLGMIFALLRVFGEAGKLLAVLLMTLQLAAGGGVMPVELSGGFFQAVHAWLPFTWVVKAFRASLFGAYDNQWLQAWATVMVAGGAAFLLSSFVGRWEEVDEADYRPGINV